jgi:carbohydrate-selective porin OprB
VSQTDGITNVRQLQFNGLTGANATVSLFANSQLVGTTTSAANGTWQIVTAAMADGVYDVSVKVQSASGTILTRSWGSNWWWIRSRQKLWSMAWSMELPGLRKP